jgi:glycine/D-amino acid oxidase-like deaminating enzyme
MSVVSFNFAGKWDARVPLLIIGAGAVGICAALAAKDAGVESVVIERDVVPGGSTALPAGLVPAAGTRFQRAEGVADSERRRTVSVDQWDLDLVKREGVDRRRLHAVREPIDLRRTRGRLIPH